ncbi:MAG: hypothetical protein IPK91_04210 [Saprospiraceae bacterium]|nr:hypothetical protein [Saprospiraceae bacterium]
MNNKYLFSLLISIFLQMLNAQSPLANYSLLDMDNGLSSINLTSVCVDTNNFLWIASANGLQVYDGNTFYKIPYGLGKKIY